MSTASRRRLIRDFKRLSSDPPGGVSGAPCGDNIMIWNAVIFGPGETPFEDGTFRLLLTFDEQYPNKPPSVKFLSKMFHPNVYANGELCLDILQNRWSPTYDVAAVLTSIQSLLHDPNPNSPANSEAASLYSNNMKEYIRRVRQTVELSWVDSNEVDDVDNDKQQDSAESIQTKKKSPNENKLEIANQLRHLNLSHNHSTSNSNYNTTYSADDAKSALYWLSLSLTPASLSNNTQVHQHVLRFDGWVSISHLFKHTPFLNYNKPFNGQQQTIAHFVKKYPEYHLECILDNDKGICLRRIDTLDMDMDINHLTVYIEGLPAMLSDYYGVLNYLIDKIPEIQTIQFPRLFSKNNDTTYNSLGTYRGMVFVSFWNPQDVSSVLDKWPWIASRTDKQSKNHIRSLSFTHWNQLKEEYLALCDRIRSQNQSYRAQLKSEASKQDDANQDHFDAMDEDRVDQPDQPLATQRPQFPINCVLQITDLDPTTNKPSIRSDILGVVDQSECAYIEYVKALCTAVIRFNNANAALKAQQALGGELLSGISQVNYWNNIPERLRIQAMEKSGQLSEHTSAIGDDGSNVDSKQQAAKSKRRKSNKGDLIANENYDQQI